MTKIDELCELVARDVANTFRSPKVEDAIKRAATVFGLPVNQIYPVKNYESETGNVTAVDVLGLDACRRLLEYANSFIDSKVG